MRFVSTLLVLTTLLTVGASKEAQAVKPPAKVQGARKQGAHSDVPYGHS